MGSLNGVDIGVMRDLSVSVGIVMGVLNIVVSGDGVLSVVRLGSLLVGGLVMGSNGNVANNGHGHVRCFVMGGLVVRDGLVLDGDLVMNDSLVVDWGSLVMDWGLVVRGNLVHLLGHEFLEKRLRDFNVFDVSGLVSGLLVNDGCLVMGGNSLVMGCSDTMLRGAHVPDLGLGSVLRCLDVADSRLLDIAGLSVVRLSVHRLLHVSGLSIDGLLNVSGLGVDGLTVVGLVGCIGASVVVCIIRLFFSGSIGCNNCRDDKRGETSHSLIKVT